MSYVLNGNVLQIPKIMGNSAPLGKGLGALAVGGLSSPYTVLAAVYQNPNILLTGTLAGNLVLVLPLASDSVTMNDWVIHNLTSGAFTVTIQGTSGASVVVPQGKRTWIGCDNSGFFLLDPGQ
jgi:hypothetical protein